MTERTQPKREIRNPFSRLLSTKGDQEATARTRIERRFGAKYPYLSSLMADVPTDQAKSILDDVGKLHRNSRKTLERLFTVRNNDSVQDVYFDSMFAPESAGSLVEERINDLLENPGILTLLPIMWKYTFEREQDQAYTEDMSHTKLALSMLMGKLPLDKASTLLKQEVSGVKKLDYEVKYPQLGRYLCDSSELLMQQATSPDYHSVVLVDSAMLAKVAPGKLTAVCLYPIEGTNGILVPGVWYSPKGDYLREGIKQAHDDGRMQFDTETSSQWEIMRPIQPYTMDPKTTLADYLDNLKHYALNLPVNPPKEVYVSEQGNLVSRKEARQALGEYL